MLAASRELMSVFNSSRFISMVTERRAASSLTSRLRLSRGCGGGDGVGSVQQSAVDLLPCRSHCPAVEGTQGVQQLQPLLRAPGAAVL
ncbi:hypothetical protein F7725_007578 [Dissostichus mawsoni]|uniref:Uncharacterized protein n=1 Tax=Dissostichus mawsoni TaxID=36200 RepID=A0A7J5Y4T2_DISMA|nr:hypothetical protein F7725_007578 [Dissostichus mawsoni]